MKVNLSCFHGGKIINNFVYIQLSFVFFNNLLTDYNRYAIFSNRVSQASFKCFNFKADFLAETTVTSKVYLPYYLY